MEAKQTTPFLRAREFMWQEGHTAHLTEELAAQDLNGCFLRGLGQYSNKPYRGLSTRVIGVMVMIHSDNKGLVLPPRVSKFQVVIIPVGITAKTSLEVRDDLVKQIQGLAASLKENQVRTEVDNREG